MKKKLTIKQKIIFYILFFLLLLIICLFIFIFFKNIDKQILLNKEILADFKNQPITLNIYNKTNNIFKIGKTKFYSNSFVFIKYYDKNNKIYFKKDNKKINLLKKQKELLTFLNSKLDNCQNTINDIFSNFRNILENNTQQKLSIILESKENQASLKFSLLKEQEDYILEILQTTKKYINYSPNNIHNDIFTFKCKLKSTDDFIISLGKLIET